ncbi:hypothetical protein [Sphingomonas colocasiae]|uniref:Cbb3-type cytochrome oxidase assembly protein CcoS n=1 Tax=Sphingomonas colocasiae TaxID=1848973 RepID=A0ABS7PKU6_9SPHN|nr:hypothetical protein [Sphingomonas colocasiae]MBY8821866.1 hypothetical protein [Sphingomonas colocasiae]
MSSLWWMIPIGAFMLWCVVQFIRGGDGPSDRNEDSTSMYDSGRDYSD